MANAVHDLTNGLLQGQSSRSIRKTFRIFPCNWSYTINLEVKSIAILKPGKAAADPSSYWLISLQLFERVLLVRLSPLVKPNLPKEQAGFRPGRSRVDQVLAPTTHILSSSQRALKTGVALIDLSVHRRHDIQKVVDELGR